MGARALKLMVILLCSINSLIWLSYTQSPIMALVWAGTAIGFVFWIVYESHWG
jgi:hypothetical protein